MFSVFLYALLGVSNLTVTELVVTGLPTGHWLALLAPEEILPGLTDNSIG